MHLYAFIAIFVPKLVGMATTLCPLCTGLSQMKSRWHKPYLETKLCMDVSHTTEIMAIVVIFWSILTKIWLAWQRPLDPCNQKCLLWIDQRRKPHVISNRIFVISHRHACICIYSNFSPKIGCRGNATLSLVYGSVTDEFSDSANPVSKPNSAWICCIQLKLWPFCCDFLAYFRHN